LNNHCQAQAAETRQVAHKVNFYLCAVVSFSEFRNASELTTPLPSPRRRERTRWALPASSSCVPPELVVVVVVVVVVAAARTNLNASNARLSFYFVRARSNEPPLRASTKRTDALPSPPRPQTGFVTVTNPEEFMKYPGPVVEQLTKAGAGYVGAKGDFAADADAVEDASDVRRVLVTLVPIRPRRRGERRSLRTFPGVSLRPHHGFNPRPRRLSTPPLTPFNSTPTFARMDNYPQPRAGHRVPEQRRVSRMVELPGVRRGESASRGQQPRLHRDDRSELAPRGRGHLQVRRLREHAEEGAFALFITLVPIRSRSRGGRRSLRSSFVSRAV